MYLIERTQSKNRKTSFEVLFSICENRIRAYIRLPGHAGTVVQQKYLTTHDWYRPHLNFIIEWNDNRVRKILEMQYSKEYANPKRIAREIGQ